MTLSFLLSAAAAGLLCLLRFEITPEALFTFLWLCFLIKIALKDLNTMTIPDSYNLCLAVLAVVEIVWTLIYLNLYGAAEPSDPPVRFGCVNFLMGEVPSGQSFLMGEVLAGKHPALRLLTDRLLGMLVVSFPMLLTDFIIPAGFGGGDIKLMAAAGLFLGWRPVLMAAVMAFAAAGVYSVFLLLTGRAGRRDAFAFGPFLCAGLAVAELTASKI